MSERLFRHPLLIEGLKKAGVSFLPITGKVELPDTEEAVQSAVYRVAVTNKLYYKYVILDHYTRMMEYVKSDPDDKLLVDLESILKMMSGYVADTLKNYDTLMAMLADEVGLGEFDSDDLDQLETLLALSNNSINYEAVLVMDNLLKVNNRAAKTIESFLSRISREL